MKNLSDEEALRALEEVESRFELLGVRRSTLLEVAFDPFIRCADEFTFDALDALIRAMNRRF